jgi:hypothetical protein
MKKFIFTIISSFIIAYSFAQSPFSIEKIDSVSKSKTQIYADTKMFIAETWKSAKDVIQNDDKENGIILIKGVSIQSKYFQMNDHKWVYSYTVKFLMKEGKYKIILGDVKCTDAYAGSYKWPLIEFCDNCEFPGYMKTSINKQKWTELMDSLKKEFVGIVDAYDKYIKTSTNTSNW